ncbi:lipid asymmetry maintenance protein MlaB [Ningiella sp. W23]|uniref:STAS domain-containing protein n=1 Tax=Ningiella sp. W23 TaxID=3023715 RepID=UPI0037583086
MNININFDDAECPVVCPSGTLDRDSLTQNLLELLDNGANKRLRQAQQIQIDLSKVERTDTAGLAWLINAIRDFSKDSKQLKVINIPNEVLDLARLSNAQRLLTPTDSGKI